MEYNKRNIGFRVAAGFLAAITIIFAVFASGISLPTMKAETGQLTVLLTDAPVDVDELWLTITDLELHKVGAEDGGWIPLIEGDEITFDLLEYQEGATLNLASVTIATGTYNKIRMTVTDATAVYIDEEENSEVTLKVPPGHIDVITQFDIENGENVVVLIDMEPDWVAISKSNNLRPVLKANISQQPPPTPEGG